MEFAAHLPLLSHGKRQSDPACADGCHGWRWGARCLGDAFQRSGLLCDSIFSIQKNAPKLWWQPRGGKKGTKQSINCLRSPHREQQS